MNNKHSIDEVLAKEVIENERLRSYIEDVERQLDTMTGKYLTTSGILHMCMNQYRESGNISNVETIRDILKELTK